MEGKSPHRRGRCGSQGEKFISGIDARRTLERSRKAHDGHKDSRLEAQPHRPLCVDEEKVEKPDLVRHLYLASRLDVRVHCPLSKPLRTVEKPIKGSNLGSKRKNKV